MCLTTLARRLVPKMIELPDGSKQYMNINLAWEVWKDVKFDWLRTFDRILLLITVAKALYRIRRLASHWHAELLLGLSKSVRLLLLKDDCQHSQTL